MQGYSTPGTVNKGVIAAVSKTPGIVRPNRDPRGSDDRHFSSSEAKVTNDGLIDAQAVYGLAVGVYWDTGGHLINQGDIIAYSEQRCRHRGAIG